LRPERKPRRKRAGNVTIGASLLALPASAAAVTGVAAAAGFPGAAPPADQSKRFNVEVTPSQIAYGGTVHARGAVPAEEAGRPLALQLAGTKGGSYHTLSSTHAGSKGHFSITAKLRRSGFVRVIATAAPGTATIAAGSVSSAPQRVAIKPDLTLTHPSLDALGGHPVALRGRLLPRLAGRRIQLEAPSHHGWSRFASTRTGPRGGFRLRFMPRGMGRQPLRVVFAGDGSNARSERRAAVMVFRQSVASWYDDAGSTACGFHAAYGVANRALPCGSKVAFHFHGRTVHAVVDDRGPYVGGRDWDLDQSTAAALGFAGVESVWSSQ
jgi:rare lipoprotein A